MSISLPTGIRPEDGCRCRRRHWWDCKCTLAIRCQTWLRKGNIGCCGLWVEKKIQRLIWDSSPQMMKTKVSETQNDVDSFVKYVISKIPKWRVAGSSRQEQRQLTIREHESTFGDVECVRWFLRTCKICSRENFDWNWQLTTDIVRLKSKVKVIDCQPQRQHRSMLISLI